MGNTKYTKELLAPVASGCHSIAAVLRSLHLKQTGGSQSYIKRLLSNHNIDTSHFLGSGWNRGKDHIGGPDKKTPDEILILRDPLSQPEKAFKLRRALLEIGVPYLCKECGNGPMWNGKELSLQIDHINGKRYDNRRENVRFICPNCHTQTDTFGSKNKPSYPNW